MHADRLLEPGSLADRAIAGAVVLFNIPVEFFSDLPVALEVTPASGRRERLVVGL